MLKAGQVFKLFFDFYTINELYLRCGGFRDIGYDYTVFISERIYERVKEKYEITVDKMFEETRKALVASLRSELKYKFTETNLPSKWRRANPTKDPEKEESYASFLGVSVKELKTIGGKIEANPQLVYDIFSKLWWEPSYGGKKWAKGAKLLMDVANVRTHLQKVHWIDKAMHLYHNGGFMLNKTSFRILEQPRHFKLPNGKCCRRIPLNFRANAKHITYFLPCVSFDIKQMVIPRLSIFPKLVSK